MIALAGNLSGQMVATVHDYSGAPARGTRARLISLERVMEAIARPNGEVIFDNLIPGTYDLELSARGFRTSVRRDVRVPGEPLAITLTVASQPDHCGYQNSVDYGAFSSGKPSLSGHIEDEDSHKGILGAALVVTNAETGAAHRAVSDQKGNFALAVLAPGRYGITVTKPGYHSTELDDFVVPRENPTILNLGIDRAGHMHICQ